MHVANAAGRREFQGYGTYSEFHAGYAPLPPLLLLWGALRAAFGFVGGCMERVRVSVLVLYCW